MAKMSELHAEVQQAARLADCGGLVLPKLRELNSASWPFAVGAHGSLLRDLHRKLTTLASSRHGSARDLRAEIGALANSIPTHIEWLNEATAEFEAEQTSKRGVA